MNKVRKVSEGGSEAEPETEHVVGEFVERLNSNLKGDSESGTHEETGVSASFEVQASEEDNATRREEESATGGASSRNPTVGTPHCEAIDLHWLLKTANPSWTPKELNSAKDKLNQAEIISFNDLEEALQGKSILNNRLRDHGFKAFGNATLERLRNAVVAERERQRQAHKLSAQRERRRLDQESKVSMEPPTASSLSSDTGLEVADSAKPEQHQQQQQQLDDCRAPTVAAATCGDASVTAAACRAPAAEVAIEDGDGRETTKESSSAVVHDDNSADSRSEVSEHDSFSEQFPSPFVTASSQFRRGLSDGLSCGRSWEWPLTREEKKERVRLLDIEAMASYKKELDELKAKVDARGLKDDLESEDDGDGSSESGSAPPRETLDSELGIHIAG